MLRRILRITGWSAAALAALILAFVSYAQLTWDRVIEAPYPALAAVSDSAVIAHGRYLVYGPAHCASCHIAEVDVARFQRGEAPPLQGGRAFVLPPGTWYPANLTGDSVTGIGAWSDAEIARAMRHNIRRDGRWLLPMMNFARLSDDDVVAVISYLRTLPPVYNPVPDRDVNLVGRLVASVLGTEPVVVPAVAHAPAGVDSARGEYVANSISDCVGCHTARSHVTGKFLGPRYAGGSVFPDMNGGNNVYISPNLTPAPNAGPISAWTEDQFVARFRTGRVIPGSPMHWESFSRLSESDLRSVYRYLRSLPPQTMPEVASR